MANYFEKNQDNCIFDEVQEEPMDNATAMILLEILTQPDIGNPYVKVSRKGMGIDTVQIYSCSQILVGSQLVDSLQKDELDMMSESSTVSRSTTYPELMNCSLVTDGRARLIHRKGMYYFSVAIWMAQVENEGAYSSFYHNCPNYKTKKATKSSVTVSLHRFEPNIREIKGGTKFMRKISFFPPFYS